MVNIRKGDLESIGFAMGTALGYIILACITGLLIFFGVRLVRRGSNTSPRA